MTFTESSGRSAQRRRTRRAIVEATTTLLAAGGDPSIGDIADEADVSRRTIYAYFPTLDQLLLDAAAGAMSVDVDTALAGAASDVHAQVRALVDALADRMSQTLPLGRKLIKLTVEAPQAEGGHPKRGYRRVGWIEQALDPVRGRLEPHQFESLVSALACLIGWEAFIVLLDVRGLDLDQARAVVISSALGLVDQALAASGHTSPSVGGS